MDETPDEQKRVNIVVMSIIIMMVTVAAVILGTSCLTGCTLSFSNVMTQGTASDVVDSDPHTDTEANPQFSLPNLPL